MTKIRERIYTGCPFGKAPSYLTYYLDSLAQPGGNSKSMLRLTLPLAEISLPGGMSVSREVEAEFSPTPEATFGRSTVAVQWKPAGGGPFPTFQGALTVEEDEAYGTSSLTLIGDYDPPLGPIGTAFDAALGRRIARITARELLRRLRDAIESSWSNGHVTA